MTVFVDLVMGDHAKREWLTSGFLRIAASAPDAVEGDADSPTPPFPRFAVIPRNRNLVSLKEIVWCPDRLRRANHLQYINDDTLVLSTMIVPHTSDSLRPHIKKNAYC